VTWFYLLNSNSKFWYKTGRVIPVLNYLSIMPLIRITSTLDGGKWFASRPGPFTPGERALDIHSIRGWRGRGAEPVWALWSREKSFAPPGNRTPASSPSLCLLGYPVFSFTTKCVMVLGWANANSKFESRLRYGCLPAHFLPRQSHTSS
jgi:hypothetical protein